MKIYHNPETGGVAIEADPNDSCPWAVYDPADQGGGGYIDPDWAHNPPPGYRRVYGFDYTDKTRERVAAALRKPPVIGETFEDRADEIIAIVKENV